MHDEITITDSYRRDIGDCEQEQVSEQVSVLTIDTKCES